MATLEHTRKANLSYRELMNLCEVDKSCEAWMPFTAPEPPSKSSPC